MKGPSVLCLGEVMLRLDPGDARIRSAHTFTPWEGGGEYNVGRALGAAFGWRVNLVSALADNEVGHLIETLIHGTGVETSHVEWIPYDGVGVRARNGVNFTERGFGLRAPLGVSDRGHSAASQLLLSNDQWDAIFESTRPALFHTGGIYAALSENSHENIRRALAAAERHGVTVSFDFNYRPSLRSSDYAERTYREAIRELLGSVDVLIGSEFDLVQCLSPERAATVRTADETNLLSPATYEAAAHATSEEYPNLRAIISTRRRTTSASTHDLAGIGWSRESGATCTDVRAGLDVYDRVGAGDAFAAGWLHAHLAGSPMAEALNWGIACAALAMTTPGDSLMASEDEVRQLVRGRSAGIQR